MRIVPHVVDSILLAAAVGLMLTTRQYPLTDTWLTAKLVALVLYIALGLYAFRFAPGRRHRAVAWLAAIAVFAYIVLVAIQRAAIPL